jgi:hypothetical protein
VPDLVTVWNERQRQEATMLHGVPAGNVAVTVRSYSTMPSVSWNHARVLRDGRPSCRPVDRLYRLVGLHCGSEFEVPFVQRWLATLQQREPAARDAAILVRPHPFNCDSGYGPANSVWSPYGPASIAGRRKRATLRFAVLQRRRCRHQHERDDRSGYPRQAGAVAHDR